MTTNPPQPMQDLPSTVQRMPEMAKVFIRDKAFPVRQVAVVQILDFYPADEIIRRTAKDWELTCS